MGGVNPPYIIWQAETHAKLVIFKSSCLLVDTLPSCKLEIRTEVNRGSQEFLGKFSDCKTSWVTYRPICRDQGIY